MPKPTASTEWSDAYGLRKVIENGEAGDDIWPHKQRRVTNAGLVQRDNAADARAELMDGVFPLTTNADLDAKAVLRAFKYQPKLEKRHALLKSGLRVAPIFLKKNVRIEALMFVYFLAQLVCALLERQLRNAMRQRGLSEVQI